MSLITLKPSSLDLSQSFLKMICRTIISASWGQIRFRETKPDLHTKHHPEVSVIDEIKLCKINEFIILKPVSHWVAPWLTHTFILSSSVKRQ